MTIEIRKFLMLLGAAALAAAAHAQSSDAADAAPPADSPPIALTLEQARAIALQRHPRVQIAQFAALIAQESVVGARAAYLPQANLYADAAGAGSENTRILAGGLSNSIIYDRTADGIGIQQLITDFGQTSNLIASARYSAKAAAANTETQRAQTLLDVDAAYFRALGAQAVLRVATATVATNTTLVRQIAALEQSRLKSQLDVSFSQVELEQSQLLLQQAQGDVEGTQAALAEALGYRRSPGFALAEPADPAAAPPVGIDAAEDTALQHRPDLLQLRFEGDAALSTARADKDRNYPVIAAVGDAGNAITHDDHLPNRYAAGAITLNFPLFEGGSYVAEQKAAELRAQSADQQLRDAEDLVSRDVRLAWIGLNTAQQRLRTTLILVQHADEAYRLAQARYRVGSSSIVELDQGQLNATQAEIEQANARYDVLVAVSMLDYQMGLLR